MIDFGAIGGTAATENPLELPEAQVDKQAFLELLVMQLKNQDPFEPIKNEEFLSQLAQFSSLESLNNIYGEMSTSNLLQNSVHNALSTSLLGNYAVTIGDAAVVNGKEVSESMFYMAEAGDVRIEITDHAGNVVRTIDRENLGAGEQLVAWNGENSDGDRVDDGVYGVAVTHTSGASAGKTAAIFAVGEIRAVRFYGGNPVIVVGDQEYLLSDLIEVMGELPGGGE